MLSYERAGEYRELVDLIGISAIRREYTILEVW